METGKSRHEKRTGSARPDVFTDATGNPVKNSLLLAIPDREYSLLRPHLEYLELPNHQILQEPGQKIEFAYFLNHGMSSLVILTSDGRSVEVAIVGHEGMVGTPLAVGLNRGPYRVIIQISASGFRLISRNTHASSRPAISSRINFTPCRNRQWRNVFVAAAHDARP